MKGQSIILGLALIGGLAACGDDGNGGVDAPPGNEMPALGATQIDRMGRPAIATALQETFNGDEAARNAAKDAYNQNASPANWAAYAGAAPANAGEYASGFYGSLAILDSLDANCGNQLAFDQGYGALAGVLAGDLLYVNSASGVCDIGYLAVEANALGVVPNTDCGGRTLVNDIADLSYSVLAAGALSVFSDLPDGRLRRLATLSPGMGFGEPAMVEGATRTASVRADQPSVCWVLKRADLDGLDASAPVLKIRLLENLLRSATKTFDRLSFEAVAEQL